MIGRRAIEQNQPTKEVDRMARFTSLHPSNFDSSFDSNHGEKLLSLAIHSEQNS